MEKRESFYTVIGMKLGAATMKNSMKISKKQNKNRVNIWSSNPIPDTYLENMKSLICKDMIPQYSHNSIYNSQDMEATSVSVNRQMDKEDGVWGIYVYMYIYTYAYIHNGILLDH